MIEYAKITYRKLYEYSKLTKYINPTSTNALDGTYVGTGIQDTCSKTMYHVEDSYTIDTYISTV